MLKSLLLNGRRPVLVGRKCSEDGTIEGLSRPVARTLGSCLQLWNGLTLMRYLGLACSVTLRLATLLL